MNIVQPGSATTKSNGVALAREVDLRGPPLADDRMLDGNRHLDDVLADGLPAQPVAVDPNRRRLGDPADRHPNQLQRRVRRAHEKLRRLRRSHPHSRTLRPPDRRRGVRLKTRNRKDR